MCARRLCIIAQFVISNTTSTSASPPLSASAGISRWVQPSIPTIRAVASTSNSVIAAWNFVPNRPKDHRRASKAKATTLLLHQAVPPGRNDYGLELLEPCAVKVASTVPRGGGGRKAASLTLPVSPLPITVDCWTSEMQLRQLMRGRGRAGNTHSTDATRQIIKVIHVQFIIYSLIT